jgi:hypothetical protein
VAAKLKSDSTSYRAARRRTAPRVRRKWNRPAPVLAKIVSGGQTGVDRAALDFARAHGLPHGGWCPHGRRAEDGEIASVYALRETPEPDYPQRTEWNVRDSDGTVIFTVAPELTGGSALTQALAVQHRKPVLHLAQEVDGRSAPARLRAFLRRHQIKVLNVAGPRLSTEPGARAFASRVLEAALSAAAGVQGRSTAR